MRISDWSSDVCSSDLTPDYWKPLVITLGGTGIRWGELAALTVGDVDTENGALRITKAEKQDPDNPSKTIVGPPKTKKGRRTVSLPRDVLDVLEPLLEGRKRTDRQIGRASCRERVCQYV